MPAAIDSEMIGREFAGYRIEALIGRGKLGAVYRAYDPELNGPVALKLLHAGVISPSLQPHFEQDASVRTGCAHRHVVAILDGGVSESIPFWAMELLDGQTLAQAIGDKPLAGPRATKLMTELLAGLSYVHESGLVHGDLEPSNVFLARLADGTEQVKLLDFGLTKLIDPNAKGDARADVYSAALVCIEMLTGHKPPMSEAVPLVHELCTKRVARPELERVLQRALAPRADERQADAPELAKELRAVPEPWIYEGRDATKARRRAALAVREALQGPKTPLPDGAAAAAASSLLRAAPRVLRKQSQRLARLGVWTLAIVSLVMVGIAAAVSYLSSDAAHPGARRALERALPELEAAASRSPDGAKEMLDAGSTASTVPAEQAVAASPTRRPRVAASNPWQAPVPSELRGMRWKIEIGQEGDHEMLKDLKKYARKQAKDPRGPLLLARLYANRDAWDDAVAQYKVAYDRDPSSRGDPRMLKDLVSAVARKESSWRATMFIPDVYGTEALPEIKRVLQRTHDTEERLRLEQLAHTLSP